MATTGFIFFLALSFIFYDKTYQQECPTLEGYDLKNLTIPSYWTFDLDREACINNNFDSKCHFYFALCHTLPNLTPPCVDSSVCQFNGNTNTTIVELGHYRPNPFAPKETNGFYANFSGGQILNRFTNKTCMVSVVLEFDCNKNSIWTSDSDIGNASLPTQYTGISADSCEIYIKFDYAGACHKIIPPTTTGLTTQFNPTPSKICVPPVGYNITILTQAPYWIFNIKSGCSIESNESDSCTLFMSFCKPIESLIDCDGTSACIRYPNQPGSSVIVGNYTEDPFTSYEKNGFITDYLPGETVINKYTQKECLVSISLKFDCDLNANWEVPPKNQPGVGPEPIYFQSVSSDSCQIKMIVPYSGACKEEKKTDKGLSFGSVLLIIFVVTVFSYLVLGSVYNVFVKKQSGYSAIPHSIFWSSMLLYSLEGFIFTWRYLTCQKKRESQLKYESI